ISYDISERVSTQEKNSACWRPIRGLHRPASGAPSRAKRDPVSPVDTQYALMAAPGARPPRFQIPTGPRDGSLANLTRAFLRCPALGRAAAPRLVPGTEIPCASSVLALNP